MTIDRSSAPQCQDTGEATSWQLSDSFREDDARDLELQKFSGKSGPRQEYCGWKSASSSLVDRKMGRLSGYWRARVKQDIGAMVPEIRVDVERYAVWAWSANEAQKGSVMRIMWFRDARRSLATYSRWSTQVTGRGGARSSGERRYKAVNHRRLGTAVPFAELLSIVVFALVRAAYGTDPMYIGNFSSQMFIGNFERVPNVYRKFLTNSIDVGGKWNALSVSGKHQIFGNNKMKFRASILFGAYGTRVRIYRKAWCASTFPVSFGISVSRARAVRKRLISFSLLMDDYFSKLACIFKASRMHGGHLQFMDRHSRFPWTMLVRLEPASCIFGFAFCVVFEKVPDNNRLPNSFGQFCFDKPAPPAVGPLPSMRNRLCWSCLQKVRGARVSRGERLWNARYTDFASRSTARRSQLTIVERGSKARGFPRLRGYTYLYLCRQADVDTGSVLFMYLCLLSSTCGTLTVANLRLLAVSMLFEGFMVHLCHIAFALRSRISVTTVWRYPTLQTATADHTMTSTEAIMEYWTATNQIQFSMRISSQHLALAASVYLGLPRVMFVYMRPPWFTSVYAGRPIVDPGQYDSVLRSSTSVAIGWTPPVRLGLEPFAFGLLVHSLAILEFTVVKELPNQGMSRIHVSPSYSP
ncbi:hypothetical protein C8R45DRAFT_923443 [Mycena sanguinolenta]|nr:hypothetical protein C8R45DRAFT_923443 [Mycena sanguinolenta]